MTSKTSAVSGLLFGQNHGFTKPRTSDQRLNASRWKNKQEKSLGSTTWLDAHLDCPAAVKLSVCSWRNRPRVSYYHVRCLEEDRAWRMMVLTHVGTARSTAGSLLPNQQRKIISTRIESLMTRLLIASRVRVHGTLMQPKWITCACKESVWYKAASALTWRRGSI